MLSQVSTPRSIGRVSGFGWGMGYLGGIVLLLIVYFGFIQGLFGVPDEDGWPVRIAMLVSAAWFGLRSEEHTSELQSLMRISYAVFCLKKKKITKTQLLRDKNDMKSITYRMYTRTQMRSLLTYYYKSIKQK